MAFPLPLQMISIYHVLSVLHLFDTHLAVIVGHTLLTLPIVVWLTKGFIDDLPVEVEQSAYIDGAGPVRIPFGMVLPMMRPGPTIAARLGGDISGGGERLLPTDIARNAIEVRARLRSRGSILRLVEHGLWRACSTRASESN